MLSIAKRLKRMVGTTGLEPATSTVSVEVQQPVIDSKGVNNRRNRQNRNTRRNLLPNCYQKLGKWVRGRIVGDRPLCFHTFVVLPAGTGHDHCRSFPEQDE